MFFTDEYNSILASMAVFAFRYYFIAGILYYIFYIQKWKSFVHLKLDKKNPAPSQLKTEFIYGGATLLVYSFSTLLLIFWYQQGWTKIYLSLQEYGYFYLIFSIAAMIILHDTYFYWTHWLMHKMPFLYRFHKIHHRSHNTNPWSTFSFHPVEALITLSIIPIIVFLLPVHPIALLVFSTILTVYNIWIHLGFKTMVPIFKNSYQNTPENHDFHHKNGKHNFGFYFIVWDKIMNTYK